MMSSRLARPAFAAARTAAPRTAIQSQVRTYAAPAANSKPPVALFGLDGTYANALVCSIYPQYEGEESMDEAGSETHLQTTMRWNGS